MMQVDSKEIFQRKKYYIIFLYVSMFAPYVLKSPPVKLYSIILYAILLIRIIFHGVNIRAFKELGFLLMILMTLLISSVINEINNEMRFLASLERVTSWIVASYLIVDLKLANRESLLFGSKIYAIILSLNSLIQVYQVFGGEVTVIQNLYFADFQNSIANNAASLGRYLGIFNQPLELGIASSIALMMIVVYKPFGNKLINFVIGVLVTVGGLISVSKVFVLLCVFLLLVRGFISSPFYVLALLVSIILIFLGLNSLDFSSVWSGFEYLSRFTEGGNYNDFIGFITASRFGGQNSDVEDMFFNVTKNSPLLGFGLGSTQLLDNGFLEFYYQGGIVCMFFYILYLVRVLMSQFDLKESKFNDGFLFWLFIFLSNIGTPVYTMWIASIPLMASLKYKYQKKDEG